MATALRENFRQSEGERERLNRSFRMSGRKSELMPFLQRVESAPVSNSNTRESIKTI